MIENGFEEKYAQEVKDCILTHRFRKNSPPQSLEAKILFDADKLDATGAMGIARTLIYKGTVSEPIYSNFYTDEGKKIALERQNAAISFYNSLYEEVKTSYETGKDELADLLE